MAINQEAGVVLDGAIVYAAHCTVLALVTWGGP